MAGKLTTPLQSSRSRAASTLQGTLKKEEERPGADDEGDGLEEGEPHGGAMQEGKGCMLLGA
jgi:hypothetical protein